MRIIQKLVRDRIPEIIEASGKKPVFSVVESPEKRSALLLQKLQEEVDEFVTSYDPAELADILEVVYALAIQLDITPETLEEMRAKKATENGRFSQSIFLESIE